MTPYQLAKLVSWAGKFRSRKQMQRVVFLLQAAGCPLDAGFELHHRGPYSEEVARLTNQMVEDGLLSETARSVTAGQQYSYRLTARARRAVEELEATGHGTRFKADIAQFQAVARQLVRTEIDELELAAAIVYFAQRGKAPEMAFATTCQFSNLAQGGELAARAKELANRYAA